jgi:hypothetical protein
VLNMIEECDITLASVHHTLAHNHKAIRSQGYG